MLKHFPHPYLCGKVVLVILNAIYLRNKMLLLFLRGPMTWI